MSWLEGALVIAAGLHGSLIALNIALVRRNAAWIRSNASRLDVVERDWILPGRAARARVPQLRESVQESSQ